MTAKCVLCGEHLSDCASAGESPAVKFSSLTIQIVSHLVVAHENVWQDITTIMGEMGQVLSSFWARGEDPQWEQEQKAGMDAVIEEIKGYVMQAAAQSYGRAASAG